MKINGRRGKKNFESHNTSRAVSVVNLSCKIALIKMKTTTLHDMHKYDPAHDA